MLAMFPFLLADITESRPAEADEAQHGRIALELNPVSIVSLYRAGLTVEFSIPEHFALNLTPSYEAALNGGLFGEVGIRRYTGLLSGAFVGISVLGGAFSYRCEGSSTTRNGNVYGFAGDVGYQWVTRHRVVIGIGAGAQIQRSITDCKVDGTELEQPVVVPSVAKTGVLPRLQFSIGYSWST
jgi:hypothetical protein